MGAKKKISSPDTKIKMIGVGEIGISALKQMRNDGYSDIEFLGINSTEHDLDDLIQGALYHTEAILITAGIGDGSSSDIISIMAGEAKKLDILCVCIVAYPLASDDSNESKNADRAIERIRSAVDALIVLRNDHLQNLPDTQQEISSQAVQDSNKMLCQGIGAIWEMMTHTGDVQIDFSDVKHLLSVSGKSMAILGIGQSKNGSAIEAARQAVNYPLMERDLHGAHALIINITASASNTRNDAYEAMNHIQKQTGYEDIDIILGTELGKDMGGTTRVVFLATDFDEDND